MKKTRARSVTFATTASAVLVFSLAGCANPLDLVAEGVSERIISEVTDGAVVDILSTEIPADFPDIPRPSGTPAQAFTVQGDDGPMWTLSYVFSDDEEHSRLGEALIAAGFSEVSNGNVGEILTALYSNDEFTVVVSQVPSDVGFGLQYVVTAG
ncbi:hypothetical protein ACFC3F_07465 [Microbacterium sp. NPDC055910]|uniref:hypothetical protein n=1 Tax=Microbacterium sp. NPDC055910 TaxID=3345659 RepID=UPI0035E0DE22